MRIPTPVGTVLDMTTTQTTTTYYIQADHSTQRRAQFFKGETRERGTGRKRVLLMRTTTGAQKYTTRESAEATCETLTRLYWQIQWTVIESEV